ncbi:MAG: DUF1501 domain-containing protein [Pirellulales bacterium]
MHDISLLSKSARHNRRDLLRAGLLGMLGVTLPRLLRADAVRASKQRGGGPKAPRAKSCILLFMEGGPAHQDMWDMKPDAPAEVRGDFKPIGSSIPGVHVCEHLPLMAKELHRVALVRSVHHGIVDHNAGAYYALTGRSPAVGGGLIVRDEPDNFPPFGAVLGKLRPVDRPLPAFVHLPDVMSNNGYDLPGQRAGFLGAGYDPLVAGDPSAPRYEVPGLGLQRGVSLDRVEQRRELLARLNEGAAIGEQAAASRLEQFHDKAFHLLSSPEARRAFDLSRESTNTRERYGLPDRVDRSVEARKFGGLPHLGQCTLLARRLIEAGVRLVTIASGRRFDQAWDTHRDHFPLLKRALLPYFDRAFSALLADLAERGLLDETLVVAMGEFGRTPRLGQITSSAGAAPAGRDHWPHCYTVVLAGGGIQGGVVHGASDRHAAYPARDAVTPEDVAATIYRALGLDPQERIVDALGRPQHLALGEPIDALF